MSRKVSPSANRSYGVQRVTRVWGRSRATLYRHRQGGVTGSGRRPGPLGVRRFATIEELRQALHAFKDSYNRTWIVERHGYQTPAAVRAAQLAPLLSAA